MITNTIVIHVLEALAFALLSLWALAIALRFFRVTLVRAFSSFRSRPAVEKVFVLLMVALACLYGGGKNGGANAPAGSGLAMPRMGLRDGDGPSANALDEAFSDGRFFRIDSIMKSGNAVDIGTSWSAGFFATGSVVNLYGRWGALTNASELLDSREIDDGALTNASFSVEIPGGVTNAAFFRASSSCDADGDGLPDWFENGSFGSDPNSVDTDGDGFPDSAEYVLGQDPVGTVAPEIEGHGAGTSACRLGEPFSAETTNALTGPVYVRTVNLSRRDTFTQYFLSADPTGAMTIGASGFEVTYFDDAGNTGKVAAAELGSGLRLSRLAANFNAVTVMISAVSNGLCCASDLHLVAYRPGIDLDDAREVGPMRASKAGGLLRSPPPSGGVLVVIGLTTGVTFDYSERPSDEPISTEEDQANPFEGIVDLAYDPATHVLTAAHPGSYPLPDGRTVIFLRPSVHYGYGHGFVGTRVYYNPEDGTYSEEPP